MGREVPIQTMQMTSNAHATDERWTPKWRTAARVNGPAHVFSSCISCVCPYMLLFFIFAFLTRSSLERTLCSLLPFSVLSFTWCYYYFLACSVPSFSLLGTPLKYLASLATLSQNLNGCCVILHGLLSATAVLSVFFSLFVLPLRSLERWPMFHFR